MHRNNGFCNSHFDWQLTSLVADVLSPECPVTVRRHSRCHSVKHGGVQHVDVESCTHLVEKAFPDDNERGAKPYDMYYGPVLMLAVRAGFVLADPNRVGVMFIPRGPLLDHSKETFLILL